MDPRLIAPNCYIIEGWNYLKSVPKILWGIINGLRNYTVSKDGCSVPKAGYYSIRTNRFNLSCKFEVELIDEWERKVNEFILLAFEGVNVVFGSKLKDWEVNVTFIIWILFLKCEN